MTFERALHTLPLGATSDGYDLLEWNRPALWRQGYWGRWAHIARQGTWNVERDQAAQRLRRAIVLAALLCLGLGMVTLLSLWQS